MSNIIRPFTGTLAPAFTSIASGTELSSIGASFGVLGGIQFDNSGGGALPDTFADISLSCTGTTPAAGTSSLVVLVYPLNQDGSTVGPGDLVAGAAALALTPQLVPYQKGVLGLAYSKTSATLVGFTTIEIPFSKFFVGIFNPLANAVTSATVKLKSWSYTDNG